MPSESPKLDELIPTRDSLLSRLKDWKDEESWRDFFNTYWRLVYGVAIKAGLTDQEAQEVVQETVITVARRIPEFHYDPEVCSFKTWLLNLTRWRIIDQMRKRKPDASGAATRSEGERTATVERLADPAGLDLEHLWAEEWERYLLEHAAMRVKRKVTPEQYQMFSLVVLKGRPVKAVARELGVSLGTVYLARHQVARLLKKEIQKLDREQGRDLQLLAVKKR